MRPLILAITGALGVLTGSLFTGPSTGFAAELAAFPGVYDLSFTLDASDGAGGTTLVEAGEVTFTVRCDGSVSGTGLSSLTGKNFTAAGAVAVAPPNPEGHIFLDLEYGVRVDTTIAGTIAADGRIAALVQSTQVNGGGAATGHRTGDASPCPPDFTATSQAADFSGGYRGYAKDFAGNILAYFDFALGCDGSLAGSSQPLAESMAESMAQSSADAEPVGLTGALALATNGNLGIARLESGESLSGRFNLETGTGSRTADGWWFDGNGAALFQATRVRAAACPGGPPLAAPPGTDDVIMALSPALGLWARVGGGNLERVNAAPASHLIAADVDGNGQDDIIADFGPDHGLWIAKNRGPWSRLNVLSAVRLAAGDLDANAKEEVIADFGPGLGLWGWMNGSSWRRISDSTSTALTIGDLDGTGPDLIAGLGADIGTWILRDPGRPHERRLKLNQLSALHAATGNVDATGGDEVILNFGPPHGLWMKRNGLTWEKLNTVTGISGLVTADLDGSGQAEVVVNMSDGLGLWVYWNDTVWRRIWNTTTGALAVADLDGDGRDELIADLGPGRGVSIYADGQPWRPLNPNPAVLIATGNIDGN